MVDGICYTCDISRNEVHVESRICNNTVAPVEKPSTRGIKRKISAVPCANSEPKKKTGSTVMAAEARNIYKKLLHDIDKLVSKSQAEMTSIAEEDLNEISKAMKSTPNELRDRLNNHEKIDKKNVKKKVSQKKANVASIDKVNNPSTSVKVPIKKKIAKPNSEPNEVGKKCPQSSSSNLTRKPVRSRSGTRATFGRKRRKKLGKPKKKAKAFSAAVDDDTGCLSDTNGNVSDDEYELGDRLFTNRRQVSGLLFVSNYSTSYWLLISFFFSE